MSHSTDEWYFEKITLFYHQLKKEFEVHPLSGLLLEKLNRYMLEHVLLGINKAFGFGYGTIVPFYIPPYELLKEKNLKNIILYGAGDVGQGYYHLFQVTQAVRVAAWVDRQWDAYQKNGFPVESPSKIKEIPYDGILIAVAVQDGADKIRESLKEQGISEEKIFYKLPRYLIQTLPDQHGG